MEFKHTSVLLNECLEGLNIHSDGIYVDVTFGGGAVWRMSGLSPTLRMVIEDGENRIDLTFRKEQ